jgi:hypothetical protein
MSFNAYVDPLFEIPSDLPGVNPATNDRMILYYCLMTKVDGLLGDSMVFSWAGCHSCTTKFCCRDDFRKRHEPSLRVRGHGEVVLERASVVSDANPGTEEEGVVAVERGGWLDDDGSCRVRHEIFGEIPYLACQLSVF